MRQEEKKQKRKKKENRKEEMKEERKEGRKEGKTSSVAFDSPHVVAFLPTQHLSRAPALSAIKTI
jgi:hypothetical protein